MPKYIFVMSKEPVMDARGKYTKRRTCEELAVRVEEGKGEEALAEVDQALRDADQQQHRRLLVVVAAQAAQQTRQPRVVRPRAH